MNEDELKFQAKPYSIPYLKIISHVINNWDATKAENCNILHYEKYAASSDTLTLSDF